MDARHRRRVLLACGLVAVVAVLLWTSTRPVAAPVNRTTAPPRVPVTVATVSRADVPVLLSALGSVVPLNTVTVRPRVDGQLMRVMFREGELVTRGQLLAEIDPRPFQVQLEQAEGQLARDEAQLANARVDLTRYQTLWEQDSIARQNVDAQQSAVKQLEAALQVDRAAIDSARLNLTYSQVTAPLSGRVGLRLVDPGNVVSAGSTTGLVVITQIEPIAVVFTLPEDTLRTVLPPIRAGAALPVDAFDRSGATHLAHGTVLTLDNEIDQSTGTVRVKAVFDNHDRALFPEQFVNVQLLADTRRGQLVMPASAVQQGPQGTFAYVVRDGKATMQQVTVGVVEGDTASITAGLQAGDLVVTEGVDRLRDGSAVETPSTHATRSGQAPSTHAGRSGQGGK
jgi:multidrug efflux system membrane fusion protein